MDYRITHTTTYSYSAPVSICHNVVILTPQTGLGLDVFSHRLRIRPVPEFTSQRRDMFGNVINRFSLEEHHSQLAITATSRVSVDSRELPKDEDSPTCRQISQTVRRGADENWLSAIPFVFDSPRIRRDRQFEEFARQSVDPDQPILVAARSLTAQIYSEFDYDKNATQVDTPTEEAFQGRHGVCQDFAHIGVSCLRSLGIPARYVSGYLRTVPPEGKERMIGADQSHAWMAVYCGPELGWVDFDPTNNCVCGTDHIPVALGRDYSDVVPIKGVFLGGGTPTLSVSVDVAPVD